MKIDIKDLIGSVSCSFPVVLLLAALSLFCSPSIAHAAEPRPNVLWITCEDISPNLGCYGDAYAVTPNLDRLAEEGIRYTHAFAPIGVGAPSRSSEQRPFAG
jgi:N-sulfoglucosamine sulfohydrolase